MTCAITSGVAARCATSSWPTCWCPCDHAYAQRRNELGELEKRPVVMFGPYQQERWQVAYDQRRLGIGGGQCGGVQRHPIPGSRWTACHRST